MIKFLANKLKEIEKIYNKLDRMIGDKQQLTKDLLEPLIPKQYQNCHKRISSLFSVKTKKNSISWHADCPQNGDFVGTIISSYPTPLCILQADKEEIKKELQSNFLFSNLGKTRTFIPKPGDIYFISNYVIHKTNPAAFKTNKEHLCLRIWLESPETAENFWWNER